MGDTLWSNTVFVSHFNGADAATAATDEATEGVGSPHSMTFEGAAQLDTAFKKFGTASLYTTSRNTGLVRIPTSDDWDLGSGDFTIEMQYRSFSTTIDTDVLISHGGSFSTAGTFGWQCRRGGTSGLRFRWSTTGNAWAAGEIVVATATWTSVFKHIVFQRSGNTLYIFLDGALAGTGDLTGVTFYNCAKDLTILGQYAFGQGAGGWADDVRITKGAARYSLSGFTPPTAELETGPDVVPLLPLTDYIAEETAFSEDAESITTFMAAEAALNEDIDNLTTTLFEEVLYSQKRIRRVQGQIRHAIETSEDGLLEEAYPRPALVGE